MSALGRIATIVMTVGNIKAVLKQSDCTICNLQYMWLFSQLEAIAPSKEIQDCVGLHAVDSGFQVLDSSLSQLNLDSIFQSLLDSGFQSPGFLGFHKQKFPVFRNSDSFIWEKHSALKTIKARNVFFLRFFYWLLGLCKVRTSCTDLDFLVNLLCFLVLL